MKNYLNYINNFRGIAIIWIVAGHCLDAFDWSANDYFFRYLKFFMSNGSLLFIFISGYLFQHLTPKYQVKNYMVNKSKNVLLPYFICSLPAIILFSFFVQQPRTEWISQFSPMVKFTLYLLTGSHLAPFWFIPMITMFFIISPLLVKLDRAKMFYYFIPLFILISCMIGRSASPLQSFVHYFSTFVFGMFCSKYKDHINKKIEASKLVLAIIITMVVT